MPRRLASAGAQSCGHAARTGARYSQASNAIVGSTVGVNLLAVQLVDLGAFVFLGAATVLVLTHVVGLVTWLRARDRNADRDGYYPGL